MVIISAIQNRLASAHRSGLGEVRRRYRLLVDLLDDGSTPAPGGRSRDRPAAAGGTRGVTSPTLDPIPGLGSTDAA
jgi:hypothetical protein